VTVVERREFTFQSICEGITGSYCSHFRNRRHIHTFVVHAHISAVFLTKLIKTRKKKTVIECIRMNTGYNKISL